MIKFLVDREGNQIELAAVGEGAEMATWIDSHEKRMGQAVQLIRAAEAVLPVRYQVYREKLKEIEKRIESLTR